MASMNISLPGPMKAWVEAQTRSGRYANASDYVRDLIRRDQERQAGAPSPAQPAIPSAAAPEQAPLGARLRRARMLAGMAPGRPASGDGAPEDARRNGR